MPKLPPYFAMFELCFRLYVQYLLYQLTLPIVDPAAFQHILVRELLSSFTKGF